MSVASRVQHCLAIQYVNSEAWQEISFSQYRPSSSLCSPGLVPLGGGRVTCSTDSAKRASGGYAHDSTDRRGLDAATMYRKRVLKVGQDMLFEAERLPTKSVLSRCSLWKEVKMFQNRKTSICLLYSTAVRILASVGCADDHERPTSDPRAIYEQAGWFKYPTTDLGLSAVNQPCVPIGVCWSLLVPGSTIKKADDSPTQGCSLKVA